MSDMHNEVSAKVERLETKVLLDTYNRITGKEVKKFSSRAAGEKQVISVILKQNEAAIRSFLGTPLAAPEKPKEEVPTVRVRRVSGPPSAMRSKGVKRSWGDARVAKARSERTGVRAAGKEYRSVKQAFVALGLPVEKHGGFRLLLKKNKRAEFKTDTGRAVNFEVVTAP